jgi:hypothetical protein
MSAGELMMGLGTLRCFGLWAVFWQRSHAEYAFSGSQAAGWTMPNGLVNGRILKLKGKAIENKVSKSSYQTRLRIVC